MPSANRAKDYLVFPDYSAAERIADRAIHYIGVPLGIAAGILMLACAASQGNIVLTITIAIYVAGLIGMLTASAAYQLAPKGLTKERLRRIDRAAIFVMIAGTYTPMSANVLFQKGGIYLCDTLWALAAAGIFITLKYPRRFEKAMLGLYLAMGWMLVVLLHYAFTLINPVALTLLFAGGVAYTVGAMFNAAHKLKFHNPIWHSLVLIAAACQYEAIWWQLLRSRWS